MSDETSVTVQRTTSFADRMRAYKIKIDGVVVGSIRNLESATTPVSPGVHSIAVRVDWCGSQKIDFEVKPGEHVVFACGSNLAGWRIFLGLFYIIFRPNRYLWLRKCG